MQTIKLEKDMDQYARGRNGIFKPAEIQVEKMLEGTFLAFSVNGSRPGNMPPIRVFLRTENWKKILVALREELSK